MKVHITLVGGQPAPVYHGIVATKPDKVVLVYSKDTTSVLNRITSVLSIPVEAIPLHPTNPEEILSRAKVLAEKYRNDDISVNISSGLKSWSHFFGITFQPMENAHVVYMDQNNILWDYHSMTHRDDFKFDMNILFKLYGNPLEHYRLFTGYSPDDIESVKTIESLRKHNYETFNSLAAVLTKDQKNKLNQPQGKFYSSDGSYVEWNKKMNCVRMVINNKKWGTKDELIQSPNAINLVFNSGWFEYKIAQMLNNWTYSHEIRLNCIFPFTQNNKNQYSKTKNEIDIIVNTGRKLLFVECKTNISTLSISTNSKMQ